MSDLRRLLLNRFLKWSWDIAYSCFSYIVFSTVLVYTALIALSVPHGCTGRDFMIKVLSNSSTSTNTLMRASEISATSFLCFDLYVDCAVCFFANDVVGAYANCVVAILANICRADDSNCRYSKVTAGCLCAWAEH